MLSPEDRAFVLDVAKMHFDESMLDDEPKGIGQLKRDCVAEARRVLLNEVQTIGARQPLADNPANARVVQANTGRKRSRKRG